MTQSTTLNRIRRRSSSSYTHKSTHPDTNISTTPQALVNEMPKLCVGGVQPVGCSRDTNNRIQRRVALCVCIPTLFLLLCCRLLMRGGCLCASSSSSVQLPWLEASSPDRDPPDAPCQTLDSRYGNGRQRAYHKTTTRQRDQVDIGQRESGGRVGGDVWPNLEASQLSSNLLLIHHPRLSTHNHNRDNHHRQSTAQAFACSARLDGGGIQSQSVVHSEW